MSAGTDVTSSPAVAARVEPEPLGTGERGRIVVTLTVPEGCHLQSNTPTEPFMIPTTLELDDAHGIALGDPVYPGGERERFEWSPVELDVYRGRVEIEVPVAVDGGASPGTWTISGRVRSQACTATACLAPTDQAVVVELEVVEGTRRP